MRAPGGSGWLLYDLPHVPRKIPAGHGVTPHQAGFRGNKAALPSKPCAGCGLMMTWRRRWAKNWGEVKYCSDACRRKKAAHG